ncbi:MAG: hypothetical protein OEX80_10535 [Candidatus Aminicenantes bacterium]|nr:hypothetical protein [Candidatus Aminicenantes bacterium]
MKNKDTLALALSFLVIVSAFSFVLYTTSNPKEQVWVGKVFDTVKTKDGWTYIESYGAGIIGIKGSYDIEVGATYRFTYIPSYVRYYIAMRAQT